MSLLKRILSGEQPSGEPAVLHEINPDDWDMIYLPHGVTRFELRGLSEPWPKWWGRYTFEELPESLDGVPAMLRDERSWMTMEEWKR